MGQKSFIYFLQCGPGRIKIGVTTDLRSRLKSLETASVESLVVLGVTEGGKGRERELHAIFSDLRIKREWFTADERIFEWIENNTVPFRSSEHQWSPADGRIEQIAEASLLLKRIAQKSSLPLHRVRDRITYVQTVLSPMKRSRIFTIWYLIARTRITQEEIDAIKAAADTSYAKPSSNAAHDPILAALGELSTRLSLLERAVKDVRRMLDKEASSHADDYPILMNQERAARYNV